MNETTAGREPAVELIGIGKRFGAVQANRDVTLAVAKGSIHGIVGENGAGKSTLMSILYGYYQADAGQIRVDGRPARIRSSQDAIALGIGMVHQHFMLVETFTTLENVMLGAEGGALLSGGMTRTRAALARIARDFQLEIDPDAVVGSLPVGLQQRVEILKALNRGAEVLILDEPTGVLTPQEADDLFRILRALRAEGKTVILITHKLREIMAVTDAVTVMRGGTVVGTVETSRTTTQDLAEMMVGRKVDLSIEKAPCRPGETVLAVEALRLVDGVGVERVKGIDFTVRAGEIVGIAGVAGNGQSELLAALAGVLPVATGRIRFKGEDVTALAPRERRAIGIAHVPEDRHKMALVAEFAASETSILGDHGEAAYNGVVLLDTGKVARMARQRIADYDVRPASADLRTSLFSGGNQQKLVVARELERQPALLLVGQPTRGVDIGAIAFIHRRLVALREAGAAILLVSVELDEIRALADRILVMNGGEIVGELDARTATSSALGLLMAGIKSDAA